MDEGDNMSDLIERQTGKIAKDTNVPSNDCISRRAAIEAFKKELTVGESKGNYVTICSAVSYIGAKQILESLPAAQPEIIRCNSCKYWTQSTGEMKGYGLGRCDFHDADLVACNGFCYWAENLDESDN